MREKRLDRKTLRLQHSCKKVSANAEQAHFLAEWACLFISTILSGKHKSAHRNLSHSQSRYRSRGVGAGNVNQLPSSQLKIWPEHSLDCQNLPWSHKWQVETMVPEVSWHLVENFIQYLMWMTHDTYNFFLQLESFDHWIQLSLIQLSEPIIFFKKSQIYNHYWYKQ